MPDYGRYQYLLVEVANGVATLTLNRPEQLNAINLQMHIELEEVLVEVSEDPDVRAVVITGAGRAFCAGGDINAMKEDKEFLKPSRVVDGPRRLVHNLVNVKQPVICALNGAAVGVGATIALYSDMVIAAENARIGDPHVKVGLVAGDGGAAIWPLLTSLVKAKELLMTGDLVSAQEAERIGLVNRVVPESKALEASLELAQRLADGATLAIQWTKLAINKVVSHALNMVFDTSLALEGITVASRDHKEGVQAFLEKRSPKFRGE